VPIGAALLPSGPTNLIAGVITVLYLAILVRVLFSWFPGMTYSTLGRLVYVMTEWLIAPIRRFVPPLAGIDFSPAIAILLLFAVQRIISGDLIGAVFDIVRGILFLLILLLFARVAIGFFRFDPWHPFVQVVVQSSEPLARPFRQWLPRRARGFDWAPVAALAALVVAYSLLGYLNRLRFL